MKMRRIDVLSKEEIIKLLDKQNQDYSGCKDCPLHGHCGEGSCADAIVDYLFGEIKMVQRASIYTPEEAVKEFALTHTDDLMEFARFLIEKVPETEIEERESENNG